MPGRDLAEAPGLVVLEGLLDLRAGVHDEGAVGGDWLADRLAPNDENFEGPGARVLALVRRENEVVAVLEDDGCGFDAEAVIRPSGTVGRLGLLGMRERVTLVGGTLTIEATPGRGTTIFARIPLSADGGKESDG